jgi:hypothetical protein
VVGAHRRRTYENATSTGGDAGGLDTRPLQVDHGITAKCGEKGSDSSMEIRPSHETLFSVSYLVTSQGSKSRASWMMSRWEAKQVRVVLRVGMPHTPLHP